MYWTRKLSTVVILNPGSAYKTDIAALNVASTCRGYSCVATRVQTRFAEANSLDHA